jgi:hypothetical protein
LGVNECGLASSAFRFGVHGDAYPNDISIVDDRVCASAAAQFRGDHDTDASGATGYHHR